MKAIIVDELTNRMSVGEWEDPKVGTNELLIDIKATAINRADVLQKYGKYPVPPGVTPIMGLEMSGIVEEVGSSVRGWNKGDRVCALLPGGGYAEKVTIPADMAIKIPDDFSFEEAAAIPEVFLTAYLNLFELGQLEKNQTVLIHAGASGVGTAAIQLAREAGATIIMV
ncbi:alcohol dehydrogenase catalytic domain-containing protein [Heyndrickxia sp. FSL K6-6286]|uniref:alcohol dehydrogenase catalytic domain-containing protein n=1 Tax=Heyndrickxia sp. FSL K6-6286 TaxID=2921510 RepID=UPI003159B4AD